MDPRGIHLRIAIGARKMRRIVGPTDSTVTIEKDAAGLASNAVAEMIHGHLSRVIRTAVAPEEFDGDFGQGQANDLLAVTREGNAAGMIGEDAAANQRRIADPTGKLIRESARGCSRGEAAGRI